MQMFLKAVTPNTREARNQHPGHQHINYGNQQRRREDQERRHHGHHEVNRPKESPSLLERSLSGRHD